MRKEDINIIKIKKKINLKKKHELKFLLLKSILQNRKIKPVYKTYASYLIGKNKNNFYKFKNICLKNNKYSSVSNSLYVSKYVTKQYLTFNKVQNCKINSW